MITEIINRSLKSKIKSLGFYEVCNDLPPRKACSAIESRVFDELNHDNEGVWENIFITMRHYFVLDKYVLRAAKKTSLVWYFHWLQILFFRFMYLLAELLRIVIFSNKTFYCSRRTTGNASSKFVLFIYSNNIGRSDAINFGSAFYQHDFLISSIKQPGFDLVSSMKLSLVMKVHCLHLKFKYPYCDSDLIFQTLVGKALLKDAIREVSIKSDKKAAFSREAWTPMNRILLAVAEELSIKTCVFYTRPIVYEYMYVPKSIDTLLLVNNSSAPKYASNIKKQILYDYPFIPWRDVAKAPAKANTVGLLLGDEFNRWREQEYNDKIILDALSNIPGIICLARPHPQEMRRPHRRRYYNDLVQKYTFLSLDDGREVSFFQKINVLITYAKSSMVQESLLCNRPVIEFSESSGFSPNSKVVEQSAGMVVTCFDACELESLVRDELSSPTKNRLEMWNVLLSNFGVEYEREQNTKNSLEKCFG